MEKRPIIDILDRLMPVKRLEPLVFRVFCWLGEGQIFVRGRRIPAKYPAMVVVSGAVPLTASWHTNLNFITGSLWEMVGLLFAFLVVTIPYCLCSKILRIRDAVDTRAHEQLLSAVKQFTEIREFDEQLLKDVANAVREGSDENRAIVKDGGKSLPLHLVTPNAIYLCARFINADIAALAKATATGHFATKHAAVAERLAILSGPIGEELGLAIYAFEGLVRFVELDYSRLKISQALRDRAEKLGVSESHLIKVYHDGCRWAKDTIAKAREGKPTAVHSTVSFPSVRLLMVGSHCFAQEMPANDFGILQEVRYLHKSANLQLFQHVRSLVEMLEVSLDRA